MQSWQTSLMLLVVLVSAFQSEAQHGTVNTTGTGTAGVQIESDSAFPDVVVKTGDSTGSGFRIFNSSDASLLNVTASGDVAIGTSMTPPERLYVFENADANSLITIENPSLGTSALAGVRAQSDIATVNFEAHGSGRTLSRFGVVLGGWAEFLSYRGNGFAMGTTHAAPLVFGTNNVNRLHIAPDGKVGIGTASPGSNLHVGGAATQDSVIAMGGDYISGPVFNIGYAGSSFGRSSAFFNVRPDALAVAPNPSLRFLTSNVQRMMITGSGVVIGPAATVPTEQLEVTGGSVYVNAEESGLIVDAVNNKRVGLIKTSGLNTELRYMSSIPFRIRRVTSGLLKNASTSDIAMTFSAAGNVGIGLLNPNDAFKLDVAGPAHFSGDLVVDGNIAAKYQDLAEWVPSRDDLSPGTVVVLDPTAGNGVLASTIPYDTKVAGVVSAQPGIILGEAGPSKEQVATTGRVRVRVDASRGPIAVGDLLVTSDKPGLAMKSAPIDLGGVPIHRPGTIVGKALEPLASGEGEILVLLSLQ